MAGRFRVSCSINCGRERYVLLGGFRHTSPEGTDIFILKRLGHRISTSSLFFILALSEGIFKIESRASHEFACRSLSWFIHVPPKQVIASRLLVGVLYIVAPSWDDIVPRVIVSALGYGTQIRIPRAVQMSS